jgi:conjugal transfer ATP-binding protein TraC
VIGLRSRSTSDLLPVQSIKDAALILRGGALRAVLECQTLAFGIKGEAEQRAVVAGWSSLLNSLTHPLQIVIRTRRLDPSALADPADEHKALRDSYRSLIDSLADERRVLDRRFYVVVPWDAPRSRQPKTGTRFLEQRVSWVADRLRRLDLEPRRLNDHSLAELLRRPMDPASAVQPIGDDDDLADISDLAAPTALTEGVTSVTVSGRHACVLAVGRYPARLHPGWLGDFNQFEGDLDLSLHIWPSSGPGVMSFLGRRIGELSSTLRIIDEKGGRPDPLRRAALKDAIELQDRIADGSERLFDVALYLSVWADNTYDLDEATGNVETLLGTRMIHTRRLMLRMRQGLVSSMPVGVDQVRLHRVLSTSALAATFPFTGTDLPGRSGLLYGVNPATRSAVVLDRFALENHNAVVFATSGAGKSFLVKVELVRAVLGGTRVLVVDPEGEYAEVIAALGGHVVQVRPGVRVEIDPFALKEATPGSLDARIATLTTFVCLLAGQVRPRQRGAIEDAIALAYARAGFADGIVPTGLTPPRLEDVQSRLRATAGLEDVAQRLERFITGTGRWLLSGQESASLNDTAAFVLAGLPDEERVAAMFLVLERIWTELADSDRKTLVVVDEAWWLMRHPDTAAFLFRLAKTARKRRAGLTLITQDVSDVLARPEGEAMIANSALQILMKQAPQAMPRLAELFRLTPTEQSWLLNAQRGEALMVAQGRRVPFQVVPTDEEARLIAGKGVAA